MCAKFGVCIHEFPFIHHHVKLCVVCSHSLPWVCKINSITMFDTKIVFVVFGGTPQMIEIQVYMFWL